MLFSRAAAQLGIRVTCREELGEAVDELHRFDLVLLDYELPKTTGARLALLLDRLRIPVPMMVISAYARLPGTAIPKNCPFVHKSVGPQGILEAARQMLRERAHA